MGADPHGDGPDPARRAVPGEVERPADGSGRAEPEGEDAHRTEAHRADARRGEPRRPSLRGIARRLLFDVGADDASRDDVRDDARDEGRDPDLDDEQRRRLEARAILAALLETGDKAKTETVRLVAREVRGYLDALELGRDIEHLLTNYSLEIKASVHLAPLDDDARKAGPQATVGLKKRGEGDVD